VTVDDWRIAQILGSIGRQAVRCVPGDDVFRKIRLVKSEVELGHMRRIARINQDACLATLAQVRVGTTKDEIEQQLMIETARRGAKAVWLATGFIVDLPTSLPGWGAIHHGDLLVVTKTGVEPLATADGPLIVL
jgi:Xaa-Pro aminopeptidase